MARWVWILKTQASPLSRWCPKIVDSSCPRKKLVERVGAPEIRWRKWGDLEGRIREGSKVEGCPWLLLPGRDRGLEVHARSDGKELSLLEMMFSAIGQNGAEKEAEF